MNAHPLTMTGASAKTTALTIRQVEAGPLSLARGLWLLALGVALLLAQAMGAQARGAPDSFADLVDQVSGAVVNITTSTSVARGDQGPNVPRGSPLEDFFEEFRNRPGRPDSAPRRSSALGSGFVISEDGFIVTNNHVIEGADEILIEFFSGEEIKAALLRKFRRPRV